MPFQSSVQGCGMEMRKAIDHPKSQGYAATPVLTDVNFLFDLRRSSRPFVLMAT